MNDKEELLALRRLAELEAKAGPRVGVVEDVARTIPAAAARGVANLAGAPVDILQMMTGGAASVISRFFDPATAETIKQAARPEVSGIVPGGADIQRGIESVTGKLYEPKTRAGKFAGGITEAAAPGGLFGKAQAVLGGISGLGSEVAGVATNDNQIAKMVGGVVAPVGVQLAHSFRSAPGQMVREATGDLTPEQFAQAKELVARAKAQGIDLMAPEALPPSSIQALASDVMASKEGGRVMNRFLSNRPGQVRAAVGAQLDAVAPQATPDVTMARARGAATDVISQAEKARTAAVRPFYQEARKDAIPDEQISAILQSIDDALPMMSAESQATAQAFKRSLAGTDKVAAPLDDLYQNTRNAIDLPPIGATPEAKNAARILAPFNQQLNDALKAGSPNIRQGRERYQQITQEVIEPLTSGPVGRVAGKSGFDPAVPESLRPLTAIADEKVARPDSIRELYTLLNMRDRQAFPGMARTWLENAFDQAAQKVQAGENRMVGANLVKSVYGTPQQEANFIEAMRGVAQANGKDPDAFAKGAKNLMEILQATGRVAGTGSPTGSRLPTNEMARRSTAASGLEMISASPTAPLAKRLREWAMSGNYRKLAEVLTAPDSIDQIIAIGKYKPTTTTGMALAIGLLNAKAGAASGR